MCGVQGHGYGGSTALRYRYRAVGFVLVAAHLLVVGWLTLRPLTAPWVTATSPEPLATIRADLALGAWEATCAIGGSMLLLAPLGVLLPLAGGRLAVAPLMSLSRTVFAGVMISLTLQLVQSGVAGQVLHVDELLLNSAGVAVAHLAVVPLVRARLRRRYDRPRRRPLPREEGSHTSAPTIPRVKTAP
ncbi:VanZ family protein [Streptomyces sp. NPDC050617]|uniref:VanZ family protein n=1 Tax=Streptomyces sp. NPDC050617 TaxID=3154628 RepID=UPI00342427D0